MPLNSHVIETATGRKTRYRLSDSSGLYLEVSPSGSKLWRYRYRYLNKEKLLSLGRYPAISLTAARTERDRLVQVLTSGCDPSEERKKQRIQEIRKSQSTLKRVAEAWYQEKHSAEVVPEHALRNWRRLVRHVFPYIGCTSAEKIDPPLVLGVVTRISKHGHVETAHRVKTLIGQIMRYAIVHGLAERDPTTDIRDALPPAKTRHHAALTTPKDVSKLLRAMLAYDGNTVVYTALQLLPRLLVRPGELRQARWQDFDLDRREWSLTAKGGIAHLVPLSDKAIDLLQTLHVKTGKTTWVFASPISSGQPISNNTLNVALQRLGYKSVMTAHGFRAMGRTLLAEQLNFPTEIIEMQLAHRVRDVHGRAYNRAQWINERFDMMQQWSEYLDML